MVTAHALEAGSGIYKLLEKMAFSKLPHGELHDVSYLLRCHVEDWWGNTLGGCKTLPIDGNNRGSRWIARNYDEICDPTSRASEFKANDRSELLP